MVRAHSRVRWWAGPDQALEGDLPLCPGGLSVITTYQIGRLPNSLHSAERCNSSRFVRWMFVDG